MPPLMAEREQVVCQRPTHVGLELRLTIAEAEALSALLVRFRDLVDRRVITCPAGTVEPVLSGLSKLMDRLSDRQPPFDET